MSGARCRFCDGWGYLADGRGRCVCDGTGTAVSLPVKIEGRSERGPVLGFLYPSAVPQGALVVKAQYLGDDVLLSRTEQVIIEEAIRARYGGMFG